MRYGSIYLLTNRQTGEQYVGQTIQSVKCRWNTHCQHAKAPKFAVHHNIAKYGTTAFRVQELFVAFDRDALNDAEKSIIDYIGPTLNSTRGGSGRPAPMSEERKQALSKRAKALWAEPAWRDRMIAKLKSAERTPVPYEFLRERGLRICAKRWAGHVKKSKVTNGTPERTAQRVAITTQTWQDPKIRERRIQGIVEANKNPEVKKKQSLASAGRVIPRVVVEKIARLKWKPVYCPELKVSFLSQKHAADFLGVLKTSVCNAIKRKGKVKQMFTLEMVV